MNKITIDEIIEFSKKFNNYYDINKDNNPELLRVGLITEEVGELAELVNTKYWCEKDKKSVDSLNEKILDEICNIIIVTINYCIVHNLDLNSGLNKTIDKLKQRMKERINITGNYKNL